MRLAELVSLYKNGEIEEAVKKFKEDYCVRKLCPNEDESFFCAGCMKQMLLYESLYRHDPEIEVSVVR